LLITQAADGDPNLPAFDRRESCSFWAALRSSRVFALLEELDLASKKSFKFGVCKGFSLTGVPWAWSDGNAKAGELEDAND